MLDSLYWLANSTARERKRALYVLKWSYRKNQDYFSHKGWKISFRKFVAKRLNFCCYVETIARARIR